MATIAYRYHAGVSSTGAKYLILETVNDDCLLLFLNQFNFTNRLPKHSDERQLYVVEFGQSHTHFYQASYNIFPHKVQRNSNVSLGSCV